MRCSLVAVLLSLLVAVAGCSDSRSPKGQQPPGDGGTGEQGVTSDCVDADGDGYGVGPDCAGEDLPDKAGVVDANPAIHPHAAEICDGEDNDGNGLVDTDDPGFQRDPCPLTRGICGEIGRPCVFGRSGECDYGDDYVVDEVMRCDGKDNDCDGEVDEGGCTCAAGETRPCGPCGDGLETCEGGTWGRCLGASAPRPETCNARDDDCNGMVDDGAVCGRCPFEMAFVQGDAVRFCIDRWEASRSDATSLSAGSDDESPPTSRPGRLPWTEVSWGAARAACERAGKQLCTSLQWRAACALGGTYPYGNSYQQGACNDAGEQQEVAATGTYTHCVAQADRDIFDLSGNVREWISDFQPDNQREAIGGSYLDDQPALQCRSGVLLDRGLAEPMTGFRCCAVRS